MNRREIAEIRRRFQPDKSAISLIRGCYVNEKREIVSVFNRPLMSFPQEEAEKYLALFRRVLSGAPGRNLVEMTFRPDQVMEGEEHRLLSAMRNTALKVDEGRRGVLPQGHRRARAGRQLPDPADARRLRPAVSGEGRIQGRRRVRGGL